MSIENRIEHLPANIHDLSKYILVGREKLVSVRAEIRAIDKLNLARDVMEQKKEEARMLAEALLDAETWMGDLLKAIEPQSQRNDYGKFIEGSVLPDGISKNQSSAFQRMAEHRDVVERVKADARERDDLPTRTAVLEAIKDKTDKPHISYNSGNNEWYTPAEYIQAARAVLDVIDLDPASTELANTVIKANQIYTIEDDGLAQEWIGNIWLNPPYSADLIPEFINKLSEEIRLGNVESAIVLVNNATETKWFRVLVGLANAICFPTGRVKYWGVDGIIGAPLQGQAIVYIGNKPYIFCKLFGDFGWTVKL